MQTDDDDRWEALLSDAQAVAKLTADPQQLAELLAYVDELRRDHAELSLLHEVTLEHSNEIEDQLAVKVDEVEALVVNLELRNSFIREVFGRYITDDVVNTLLASPEGLQLGGEKRNITILISDVRGFSSLCERLSPEQVVKFLNIYLGAMAEIIESYRGSINEFIGDAILAVFGAPIASDDHAERAIACALGMQQGMASVNANLSAHGLPTVEMGIGVHTGEVVVGNIGSRKRAKYGIVGSHVNLTSRIESYTVGGQVLISDSTARRIGDDLEVRRSFKVQPKGARTAILIHDVIGLRSNPALHLQADPPVHRSLAQPLPLRFRVLEGKDASGKLWPGALISLDNRGELIIAAADLPDLLANIRLDLDATAEDVYAKVLEVQADNGTFCARLTTASPTVTSLLAGLPSP